MYNQRIYNGALMSLVANDGRSIGLPNKIMNYITTYNISDGKITLYDNDINFDYTLFDYIVFKKSDSKSVIKCYKYLKTFILIMIKT